MPLTAANSPTSPGWLASGPWGSFHLCVPNAGIPSTDTTLILFTWVLMVELWSSSTLPTEPAPLPQLAESYKPPSSRHGGKFRFGENCCPIENGTEVGLENAALVYGK